MVEKRDVVERKPVVGKRHGLGGVVLLVFAVVLLVFIVVVFVQNYSDIMTLLENCGGSCFVGERCGGYNYPGVPECREFKIRLDSSEYDVQYGFDSDMCMVEFGKQGLPSREVAEKMGLEYVCRECAISRVDFVNWSGDTAVDVTCSCSYGKCG